MRAVGIHRPDWDSRVIGRPSVLRLGGVFWLFYSGCDYTFEWKIGLAQSVDGVAWERLDAEPVLAPARGGGGAGVWSYLDPTVVEWPPNSGRLLMVCVEAHSGVDSQLVGFQSCDGVSWEGKWRLAVPGLAAGPGSRIMNPWLVVRGEGLELFLASATIDQASGTTSSIIRSRSRDGESWGQPDELIRVNDWGLDHPCVVTGRMGDHLWFSRFTESRWEIRESEGKGFGWTRPKAVETVTDSPWETAGILAPCVVRASDGYLMWHLTSSRTSDGPVSSVFLRRSSDGLRWTKVVDRPVFSAKPGIPFRPG